MERLKKGEKYWYIDMHNLSVDCVSELDDQYDYDHFYCGNYFHIKEEAEAMAEKIRKVLKGAIVIDKLPSEEDAWDEANKRYPRRWSGDRENSEKFDVFMDGAEWLKEQLTRRTDYEISH